MFAGLFGQATSRASKREDEAVMHGRTVSEFKENKQGLGLG